MKKRIFLSLAHMGGAEQKFIQEAFDTNWVVPLGPNVDGFESDLSQYLGENVSVSALSAGTAAIHLSLILSGVRAGDEVICQSFTFSASANPILYLGATPVFIDSEKNTWNMSPEYLEIAIKDRIAKGKKPKAIISVHLYGMPSNMSEIGKIAKQYEIPVIEDAAEALGSSFRNQKCGTIGQIGILSFNGNKIITTSGGGALVSRDAKLVEKSRFLATQARDPAPYYQHSEIGYNYRMSNVLAGIGRGQMEVLPLRVEKRRSINEFYRKQLSGIDGLCFQTEPSEEYHSNYWLTSILIDPSKIKISPNDLRLALEEENIESRLLWKPMHLQPIFGKYPYYGNGISETLFAQGLCLPSSSQLQETDLLRIYTVIKNRLI
jgi:dTDP-4-amino-4,6-dideoxygalactose transaminase